MTPRLLTFLFASLAATPAASEIIERVLANVHGEILTLSEFEARQVAAVQAARLAPHEVERFLRENNHRIFQEAVDDLLLLVRARELGLRVRPEYVDDIVAGIKKDNAIASDEAFEAQLRAEGMSLLELRRNIERSVLRRQVVARELEPKVAVTEAEVLAEFQANRERYGQPASVRLQEIVVEGAGAQARAATLAARARQGEDFAALARESSVAPTAADGGDIGRVARGDLASELASLVFALPVGGVTDPLATPTGYRVLRVTDRTEAQVPTLEAARARIMQHLTQERMEQASQAYLAQLREAAGPIRQFVREVPVQVDLPSAPGLAPGPGAPAAPQTTPSAPADDEISASPQAAPEHVVPERPPSRPEPGPTPPPGA